MHLYDVVRSGVDPLVARITRVVPVAQTHEGSGVRSEVIIPGTTSTVPVVASKLLPLPSQVSRGEGE
jgi:NADH-quinone oxidoreductase subunit M